LLGSFPNPLDFSLTTYNTAQHDFAEVLRMIFIKLFLITYYEERVKMPNKNKRKAPQFITFTLYIQIHLSLIFIKLILIFY